MYPLKEWSVLIAEQIYDPRKAERCEMKFEIKHRITGSIIFSLETDSLKLCVEASVKSGADLRGANLRGANLRGANLGDADLRGADLRGANLRYADLRYANLRSADLRGADLRGADLGGANLRGADLRGADLGGANLRGADLRGADLGDADLRGANLRGANLRYADLRDANLRSADLGSANLGYADLRGADLRSADLGSANLGYADLRGADLGGANLGDADLRDADLGGAKGIQRERFLSLLMLLDQPGKIRAYKLVNSENIGPFNGGITYEIGQSYEVKDASTDYAKDCAEGINVATLDWCLMNWQKGFKVLLVEFEAKDIACIPTASDGKFRLFRCKVIGEKDISKMIPKQKKG
jgi:uncharacterized protein YjbI with pentapeptide repeats